MPAHLLSASEIFSAALVAGLWQAALLSLAVEVLLRALPRTDARLRYGAWIVVLLVGAGLPFLQLLRVHGGAAGHAHADGLIHVGLRWSLALAGTSLLLSALRAAGLVAGAASLHRIWKRALPVVYDVAPAHGRLRRAVLCTSDDIARPSVIGFFAPRILVPTKLYAELSPAELEQIVLHECGHLRRLDDWTNLLQKLLLAVFPLNPALAWVERRLCREREIACDEHVLRTTRAPRSYAACLVHLAESRSLAAPLSLALGAWERRSELAERVHRILGGPSGRMSRTQALAFSVVLAAVVGSGSFELALAPPLVSFTAAPAATAVAAEPRLRTPALTASHGPHLPAPHLVEATVRFAAAAPTHRLALKAHARPALPARAHAFEVRTPVLLTAMHPAAAPSTATPLAEAAPPVSTDAPRIVLTGFHTYAAVPTGDGWLIIPL